MRKSTGYRLGQIIGALILTAIALFILFLIISIIKFFLHIPHFTPHEWSIAGDTIRNLSGPLALMSAILTIRVMHKTNETRAKEAQHTEFRDQMQWASDALEEGTPVKSAYAQMVVEAYAKEKPELLGLEEHRHAQEMWELVRKMYGYDIDLPQKEEDK